MAALVVPARRHVFDEPLSHALRRASTVTRRTRSALSTPATCFRRRFGLTADDSIEVHPLLLKPRDMTPMEFDIPREATRAAPWT